MGTENVKRNEGYRQVAICPGLLVTDTEQGHRELEAQVLEHMGARVQYLETIVTKPDMDDRGNPVPETGGRHDVFLAVHEEDIPKFSLARLSMGIRWVEDAISRTNGGNRLYPERVSGYAGWNFEDIDRPSQPTDTVPGTSIKKPKVRLTGEDGNAFAILANVRRELKRAKVPSEVVEKFLEESRSGDYDHLLATAMKYAEVV